MRWRHPRQGVVLPGAFVTVAEESGLIVPLGRWVLREACRQLARWTADPAIDLPCLTVNLSGRQLAEASLPDELAAILRQTGVPPERLGLELTESVLMQETSSPTAVLQDLKGLGVRLMLDDFGTGYSSLNHVKRFPIEAIKVDREFVTGVAEDEGDRHILRAIVSMASAMDVAVIAEGVETREQARWLRHLGIKLVQGYAFGRPAPAATIEALLRDGLPLERLALAFEPIDGAPAAAPAPSRAAWPRPPPPPGGATVTLGEAAVACGVSASTVRRWADTGRIAVVRTSGGHRRFPVAELRRLNGEAASATRPRSAPSRCPPTRCPRSPSCSRAPPASSPRPSPAASTTARPGLVRSRPRPRAARPLERGARRRHPQHRLRRGARRHPAARHPGRPRGRLAARAPHLPRALRRRRRARAAGARRRARRARRRPPPVRPPAPGHARRGRRARGRLAPEPSRARLTAASALTFAWR